MKAAEVKIKGHLSVFDTKLKRIKFWVLTPLKLDNIQSCGASILV